MDSEITTITKQKIIDTIKFFKVLPNSVILFDDIFKKVNDTQVITYETTILDPFLSVTEQTEEKSYNLDNLYDWYLTKNISFIENGTSIKDANPKVPEFKTLIALIIKDIILLYITKIFPIQNKNDNTVLTNYSFGCSHIYGLLGKTISDDNHTIIIKLLEQIEKIITEGYNYLEIINLIINYYKLFNFGYVKLDSDNSNLDISNKNHNRNECLKLIKSLRNLSDTCFIIYPTFTFVNYTKILYFMQAPVLILKMANQSEYTDEIFMSPIFQIWHDISFHANITHCVYKEDDSSKRAISLYQNTNNQYDIFKQKFNVIKKYINVNYKNLNNSNFEISFPERKKYFIAYILFLILHELNISIREEDILPKCTILYINDFVNLIKQILEKPEAIIKNHKILKRNITVPSNKNEIIKNIIATFGNNIKEIIRFTLIQDQDSDFKSDLQINITKSYDIAKQEIDKLFNELNELPKLEQQSQLGGKHNNKTKTKKQNTNKTKNNKHNNHKNHKIKKKTTRLHKSKSSKHNKK